VSPFPSELRFRSIYWRTPDGEFSEGAEWLEDGWYTEFEAPHGVKVALIDMAKECSELKAILEKRGYRVGDADTYCAAIDDRLEEA
jgi:hypothetical protein